MAGPEATEAHAILERGGNRGKVVSTVLSKKPLYKARQLRSPM
jgi:hypothetical protein